MNTPAVLLSLARHSGTLTAVSVYAAVQVAVTNWTEQDTIAYGRIIRDTLQSWVEQMKGDGQ